jgi:arabinofuranan 3-O-arabinosyltransferase
VTRTVAPVEALEAPPADVVTAPRTRLLSELVQSRMWPIAALLAALACVAVVINAPGWYVADNRFEFYWAPGELLARSGSIWEGTRGLGGFRYDFWPTTAVVAALRGLGLSPALAERAWHAAQLAVGGIGMVAVMRLFRPRIGPEHVVAGAFYMFSPFTVVFLIPSGIFFGFSLAPWLLYAFVRGVRERRPWRWAAVFALLVFTAGNVNYPGFPGLALAALPTLPAAIYLVHIERSVRWRTIGAWLLRAAVLCVLVLSAALVTTHYGSSTLAENLAESEQPKKLAQASSWSESWRGVGLWQIYWIGLQRRFGEYLSSVPTILLTFVAPCTALATLWISRRRERLIFAAIMLLGVAIMVGGFPPDSPSPYARLLFAAFDAVPQVAGLRSTYKAGPAMAMGVAGLLGIGVATAMRVFRPRRRLLSLAPLAAALAVIAAGSAPFWSATLYSPENRMRSVPAYWKQALDWLDRQPGDGRVLILPSTVTAMYQWGSAGDDIIDAYLSRPHIARDQFPLYNGTAEAGNLVTQLDDYLESGFYTPGTLTPIARRLGVRYVLLRNDLDWKRIGRPEPQAFDDLRKDSELSLGKTFGRPGENVLPGPGAQASDRRLPPVEVYEIPGSGQQVRATTAPPVLVSGDGAAWPGLAATGVLRRTGPVRYTGSMSPRELEASLDSGSELVITDSNRRRVGSVPLTERMASYSHTLPAGDQLDREPQDLFHHPGSQSVAFYPDAVRITSSSFDLPFSGRRPGVRPGNAFDRDESTAWETPLLLGDVVGEGVRATFREPVQVSQVRVLTAPNNPGDRQISRATIRFSDGSKVAVNFSGREGDVTFPARSTRSIEVRIAKVRGTGVKSVGFAEVTLPGLDLREFIQVPDDVMRAARRRPNLEPRIVRNPVAYQFTRLSRAGTPNIESALLRRFATLGSRDYELAGTMRLSYFTPSPIRDALAEGRLASECHGQVLTVDGQDMPVRILATQDDLTTSEPVQFVSCAPVHLGPGWHALAGDPSEILEAVQLSSRVPAATPPAAAAATEVSKGEDHVDARISTNGNRTGVIIGQSYDPTWQGRVDGHDTGKPVALDTFTGWMVDGAGTHRIKASVSAERVYRGSLVLTGVGLVLCLALAFVPARRRT